ncbi:MAG TPA: hypothetical protein VLZ31_01820 [Microbacteriaceae bacterium]|nr:hypothetical protein [Microbacteriaceae bacterium]
MTTKRPFSITFIAFLVWINGLLGVILGMMLLFSEDFKVAGVAPSAIITLITGVVTILVAMGLLHANPMARLIITVLQLVSLASAGAHMFYSQSTLVADVLTIAISVVVLLMLWSRKSNAFFAGH